MSYVWDAVHESVKTVSSADSLRITNLIIAGANRFASSRRRRGPWDAIAAQRALEDLSLSPLRNYSTDRRRWTRIAGLAMEAAHLGATPAGMHSWAAAYQKASITQKVMGAYATHNAFATALARITIGPLERKRTYRIIDPSVGAGNLLLAAIEQYGRGGTDAALKRFILSLYGVELDPQARELCCLLIWLAGVAAGVTLQQVANNIRLTNALTFDWWGNHELFDVLLMNPPWESLRHKVENDAGGERAATIRRLSEVRAGAPGLPPLYTAQGTGDRNLFKGFVELVPHLLVENGRVGALLPAAFASDAGMTELRKRYLSQFDIARWTSYENRAGLFPIDSRYKFGLLAATRSSNGTTKLYVRGFAVEPDEVDAPHILLLRKDVELIGRKYQIIPELSSRHELDILRTMLKYGTPLFDRGACGLVTYRREVDLTLGRQRREFIHVTKFPLRKRKGGSFLGPKNARLVPLLEGRSVGAYDCFQKSWVSGSGRTAVWWENEDKSLGQCRPQYVLPPRNDLPPRVALCDVTAATNTRTVIAALVPQEWSCGNTAPVLEFETEGFGFAGLGILNSMVFDWLARRLVSGLHLNKFVLEGLVWPALDEVTLASVANAAWNVCRARPRSGLTKRQQSSPALPPVKHGKLAVKLLRPLEAAIQIELAVARGLGLSAKQLQMIYDDNRGDRRGFWRYFDAEPEAAKVVREVLRRFGSGDKIGYSRKYGCRKEQSAHVIGPQLALAEAHGGDADREPVGGRVADPENLQALI